MNASKLNATTAAQPIQAAPAPQRAQREQTSQPGTASRTPDAAESAKHAYAGATTNGIGQTIGGTLSALA